MNIDTDLGSLKLHRGEIFQGNACTLFPQLVLNIFVKEERNWLAIALGR